MQKILIFSVFVLVFALSNTDSYSNTMPAESHWKPRIAVEASLLPIININSGIYKAINKNNICCNDLVINNNYFGFSFELGIKALLNNLYNIPIFDSLSCNLNTSFNYSYNKIVGSNYEPQRKVFWQNELTDLIEKNETSIYYSTLYWIINFELGSHFDSLNYHTNLLGSKLFFSLGPIIGITLNNYYKQTLSIVQPNGFLYSNGKNSIQNNYDDFIGFNGYVLGLNINFDSYWNLYQLVKSQWSKNMNIGVGLRYIYLMTSLVNSQSINHSNIALKLNLVYYFPKLH